MMQAVSGKTIYLTEKGDLSIPTAAATQVLLSKVYLAGKADSSALRVGTMKVSSAKNRPKAKESSPLSLSATAIKENGKGIFPTGQDTKPGYALALSLPMKVNT